MQELLLERPAWYVLGPLIGLVLLGLMATINVRIGALGGYSDLVERASGRIESLSWKIWFLGGILAGALLFRLLSGAPTFEGYGWLTRSFSDDAVVGGFLLGGGVLIGFGAKLAGGCTSGNGLGGCSQGSVASFAATASFMGVAIGASFAIRALGG